MQPPEIGSCNDDLTMCPVCGDGFRRVGRRRFCDDACRQEAWRRRHPIPLPVVPYVGSVILVALWKAFDVGFIGLLQAFIFAFLTVVYFELAREGLEHEAPAQAAH